MEIFASIATAVAAAILSIPVVIPDKNPEPQPESLSETLPAEEGEMTIGASEIGSAEYVAPPPPPPAPKPAPTQVVGSKAEWLAGSGIAESDWTYVDFIVNKESRWNPNATNPSSGAHGLPQALPYSKTGCGWVDAVCQLKWANGYAVARYGSWAGAYNYWLSHHYW